MTASHRLAGALVALVCGLAGASVHAQAPSARDACRASVFALCPWEAATMNRKAAKACLMRNLARASPECRTAIEAGKARRRSPSSS